VARRRRSPIQTSGDQIQNRLSYGRPWHEAHRICDRSSDQATAARTIVELKAEIETLKFVGRNEVEAPDFSRIYSDHVRRVLDQASSDHDRIRLSSLQRNAPQILPSCWMVGPTCSPIATSHRRNVVSDTSRILNTEASQQGPPQGRAQVQIGPVSATRFPPGYFAVFDPHGDFVLPISELIQWVAAQFPKHRNRESFCG
jgi:hypothetical protein